MAEHIVDEQLAILLAQCDLEGVTRETAVDFKQHVLTINLPPINHNLLQNILSTQEGIITKKFIRIQQRIHILHKFRAKFGSLAVGTFHKRVADIIQTNARGIFNISGIKALNNHPQCITRFVLLAKWTTSTQ